MGEDIHTHKQHWQQHPWQHGLCPPRASPTHSHTLSALQRAKGKQRIDCWLDRRVNPGRFTYKLYGLLVPSLSRGVLRPQHDVRPKQCVHRKHLQRDRNSKLPRERHTALDGRSATLFTSNRNPRRARRRQRRYVTFYSGRKVIFNTEERNQTMHVSTNGSENHNSPLTMLFRSIRSIPLQKNWFHLLCTYSILASVKPGWKNDVLI